MYAIVDIAGQQFKVEKDQKLYVHRLEDETGSKVSFDKVLLIDNGGKVTVGNPAIKDALVSAKVLDHVKGDKVLVFKKKRRKGYKKLNGHRQYMTQIEITEIKEKAAKPAAKTAEKKEATPKAEAAKKPAAATKAAAEKKAPAAKKPAATKAAAEKKAPAAKKPAATKAAAEKKAPAAKKPAATKAAAEKKAPAAKKPATKKTEGGDKPADKK